MDQVLWLDIARAAHMIGLAVGLGLALCADVLAVKSMFLRVTDRDVWLLRLLHRSILVGLALLWTSGLYLLHIRTGWDLAQFSPKLIVKLCVVAVLSVNALVIGGYALPSYSENVGRRFGAFDLPSRIGLSGIAGVSVSCWLAALSLGVFSQLKTMSFEQLQAIMLPMFLIGLTGALMIGICATLISRIAALLAADMRNENDKWPDGHNLRPVHPKAIQMGAT